MGSGVLRDLDVVALGVLGLRGEELVVAEGPEAGAGEGDAEEDTGGDGLAEEEEAADQDADELGVPEDVVPAAGEGIT